MNNYLKIQKELEKQVIEFEENKKREYEKMKDVDYSDYVVEKVGNTNYSYYVGEEYTYIKNYNVVPENYNQKSVMYNVVNIDNKKYMLKDGVSKYLVDLKNTVNKTDQVWCFTSLEHKLDKHWTDIYIGYSFRNHQNTKIEIEMTATPNMIISLKMCRNMKEYLDILYDLKSKKFFEKDLRIGSIVNTMPIFEKDVRLKEVKFSYINSVELVFCEIENVFDK